MGYSLKTRWTRETRVDELRTKRVEKKDYLVLLPRHDRKTVKFSRCRFLVPIFQMYCTAIRESVLVVVFILPRKKVVTRAVSKVATKNPISKYIYKYSICSGGRENEDVVVVCFLLTLWLSLFLQIV